MTTTGMPATFSFSSAVLSSRAEMNTTPSTECWIIESM